MRTLCAGVAGGLLLWALAGAVPARADTGYENDDLSVRLASAFIRFTEVSTFGGEAAANRWSPAVNPAAADWTAIDRPVGAALAGYWSHIRFDTDNVINVFGETALWDTRRFGTGVVTVSQIRSNEKPDSQGLTFDYRTDTVQLQWAKRLGSWSAGLTFNYGDSSVEQRAGGVRLFRSTADTYRYRAGVLFEPRCKWLLGLVGEYATSPYHYEAVVPTPMGLIPVEGDDTQDQVILRGGVSYQYRPYSVAYLDYQYGWFDNQQGSLTTHRVSAGVQQNLFRFLFLRGGASVDQHGNVGLLAGVGAAFSKWGTIDFGYQYNMLPELDPNFGTSQTFQFVVSVRF